MRITRIQIDGFGTWSGLALDELAEGLNVFYGPNEAGKTTLLQFVRSAFHGFSPERRARYLPPVHGGRAGGAVEVIGPDGLFTISRHDEGAAAGTSEGRLALIDSAGAACDRQSLARLLGSVDDAVYSNVFAVGLREIQELGTLSDTEAADFLYKLTTGLDRVSLVDVMRELAASRERLLASGESPSQIAQLFEERERLTAQSRELHALSRRYALLAGQRKESRLAIATAEKEADALEHSARLIEAASAVHARWHERRAAQRELATLGDVPRLAHDAIERLDLAVARRRKARRRLRSSRVRLVALKKQIAQLGANDVVWRQAPRIEALLEQEAWIATLESQSRALEAEVATLSEKLAGEHLALGLQPDSPALTDARHSRQALRGLQPLVRELRESRQRARQTDEQAGQASQTLAKISRDVDAALASRPQRDVLAAVENGGNLVAQLRRRVHLDQRLDEMKDREAELRNGARQWLDRQLLPSWVLIGLGALFVVGVVAILSGLLLPRTFLGPTGWVLAVLGAAGAGAAAAAKLLLERSATRHYEACQQQLASLTNQTDEARRERDELDARLPKGGGPLVTRLQTAEKELAALEELLPLNARRETAENEAKAADERRLQAHHEYHKLKKRWRQSLVVAGLAENIAPKQLGKLTAARKRLAAMQSRLTDKQQEFNARRQELRVLGQRVDQILVEICAPPAEGPLSDKLRVLREQLRQHTLLGKQREDLLDVVRRLRLRQAKLSRTARRWRRRGSRLLANYGASGPEHLRRLALQSARVELLVKQRDSLGQEIASALAPHVVEDDVREMLDANVKSQLEDRWEKLAGELQTVREKLRAAHEQTGRMDQELTTLAADRRPGEALLQLGIVEQQLRERIARWRVLAVSGLLLERIRRLYESERQPETLREASLYLARLTDGHYSRVWTPLDGNVLRVDDRQGNTLPLEVLSRGTREQLFLSLRLALVAAYARRGIDLPLVLDDVLVNFDAHRARLAAALLRDFAAEGRQLFVFTCHEHVFRLFKSLKANARELPPSALQAEAPEPERKRRTPKPTVVVAEPRVVEPPVVEERIVEPVLKIEPPTEIDEDEDVETVAQEILAANGTDLGGMSLVVHEAEATTELPPTNGHHDPKLDQYDDEPDGYAEIFLPHRSRTLARIGRRDGLFASSIWHDPVELEFGDE